MPLLLEALRRLSFTQTELAEATGTSIGRVNKIVTWLKEKDILLKETGKYVITRPNALADLIANQQVIRKTRTYNVTVNEEYLRKAHKQETITFCLKSASRQEKQQEYHVIDTKQAQAYFDKLPRGELQITLYQYDTLTKNMDEVRTIIDLKSVGERTLAEAIATRIWSTRQ